MKKQLLLFYVLTILALLTCSASAEVTIYQDGPGNHSKGLRDGDKIILPAEYWIEETAYSYIFVGGVDRKSGFYDKASGCLHPAEFDFVDDFFSNDPEAPVFVGKDGYYGYVYRNRCEIAIPLRYQSYGDFSEFENGYAIIGKNPGTPAGGSGMVLINRQGEEISFPNGYEAYSLPEGELVWVRDPETHLLGLCTLEGEIIAPPIYEYLGPISEGYACYCKDGKWGHMDMTGEIILPPTYKLYYDEDYAPGYSFHNGIAPLLTVTDTGEMQQIVIDVKGNIIWEP